MEQSNPTPEQQAESQSRLAAFNEDLNALMEKHGVGIVSYPAYAPDQDGAFRTVVVTKAVDKRLAPVPSPLGGEIAK